MIYGNTVYVFSISSWRKKTATHLYIYFAIHTKLVFLLPSPRSSVSSVEHLRTGVRRLEPPALPIFFPRIDDSHCDGIHLSLTAVHWFDDGYVGKQPVACKEYCAEYWLRELQESTDRCTGRRVITETTSKTASNDIGYNPSINKFSSFTDMYITDENVEPKKRT